VGLLDRTLASESFLAEATFQKNVIFHLPSIPQPHSVSINLERVSIPHVEIQDLVGVIIVSSDELYRRVRLRQREERLKEILVLETLKQLGGEGLFAYQDSFIHVLFGFGVERIEFLHGVLFVLSDV